MGLKDEIKAHAAAKAERDKAARENRAAVAAMNEKLAYDDTLYTLSETLSEEIISKLIKAHIDAGWTTPVASYVLEKDGYTPMSEKRGRQPEFFRGDRVEHELKGVNQVESVLEDTQIKERLSALQTDGIKVSFRALRNGPYGALVVDIDYRDTL